MYLVRTLTDRGKRLTIAMHVRAAPDEATAEKVLRNELPPLIAQLIGDEELKAIRKHLVTERLPDKPRFEARDFRGALGIFIIVVLSTFPVALPFIVIKDVPTALLVSRILSVLMLFGGGYALGRHAGYSGLKAGFGMAVMGVLLTMAVIALGG
jgi:VIT1/CCC1 family predicted Fe2+/Mn2+ transporter